MPKLGWMRKIGGYPARSPPKDFAFGSFVSRRIIHLEMLIFEQLDIDNGL